MSFLYFLNRSGCRGLAGEQHGKQTPHWFRMNRGYTFNADQSRQGRVGFTSVRFSSRHIVEGTKMNEDTDSLEGQGQEPARRAQCGQNSRCRDSGAHASPGAPSGLFL